MENSKCVKYCQNDLFEALCRISEADSLSAVRMEPVEITCRGKQGKCERENNPGVSTVHTDRH